MIIHWCLSLFILLATVAHADIKDGLIGYWTLDAVSATTTNDDLGNGNKASLVNGPVLVSGYVGKALSFDGSNDRVDIASDPIGTGSTTISAWIYPRSMGQGASGTILSNGKIVFKLNSLQRMGFTSNYVSSSAVSSVNSILPNTWYFVTATRDSNGIANLYINGVLSGGANQNSGAPTTGTTKIFIGNNGNFSNTFDGIIDDVRVYNRTLSSDDIQQLFIQSGGNLLTHTLSIVNAGTGQGVVSGAGINCPSACLNSLSQSEPITLTASANAGSTFAGWSGGCTGTGACTLTVRANTTLTATFNVTPLTIFNGAPSGLIPISAVPTLSVSTDKLATCKYDINPNVSYDVMVNAFQTISGTIHTATLDVPVKDQTRFYYVKCRDNDGKTTPNDYIIGYTGAEFSPHDIIPQELKIDWSKAGIPGGIPTNTVIFADFSNPVVQTKYNVFFNDGLDDSPGITKAIADASQAGLNSRAQLNVSDKINLIYLPEGTYNINTPINFNYAVGVAMRGDGMGKTILQAAVVLGGAVIASAGGPLSAERKLVGGYTKGSTSITVDDAAGVKVGTELSLFEANDPDLVWERWNNPDALRQRVMVTKVDGKVLEFTPPLVWTFKESLTPRWKYQIYGPMRFCGIENLTLQGSLENKATYMVWFTSAYASWIKNVESKKSVNTHFYFSSSLSNEVRGSYAHDTFSNTDGYGLACGADCTALRVEDNIFTNARVQIILNQTVGSVFAYNYASNTGFAAWPDKQNEDFNTNHGAHGIMDLWEGNIGPMFQNDGYHGSTSHITMFRNHFSTKHADPNKVNNRKAIDLCRFSYYHNIAGNVLGSPGWPAPVSQGFYEIQIQGYPYNVPTIYRLGYPNVGNTAYSLTNPPGTTVDGDDGGYDHKVKATLLRHGNFDYHTNSTIWDPNISNHTLPPSLYLFSKPNWWPGNVPWPPIGPDVAGLVNKIPAQIRYEGGVIIPPTQESNGDVSGDGKVTMYDSALVLRFTLGSSLTDEQKTAADKNGDGKIDGADVVAIAKRALGL